MKALFLATLIPLSAGAVVPISGRPVESMTAFDTVVTDYMEEYDVEASLVGIMREGKVVYLKGFGYRDAGLLMRENAVVRQASVTKPATAAVVRKLAAAGAFGPDGLQRRAFNLTVNGANNNGILNVLPSSAGSLVGLTDQHLEQLSDITLEHLIQHRAGFDRNDVDGPRDFITRTRRIAGDLGVLNPPSRQDVMRWMLGWPLTTPPGDTWEYSNFGYLVLGEVIDAVWPGGYVDSLHQLAFSPKMWIPASEVRVGRSTREDRDPREPWYRALGTGLSIFDDTEPIEQLPITYGGNYSLPMMRAHGGMIASGQAMLHLGNTYELWGNDSGAENPTGTEAHTGRLWGTETVIDQRDDGTVLYIFLNKTWVGDDPANALIPLSELKEAISELLDQGPGDEWSWPETTSDGFWIVPTSALADTGLGGYHDPWRGFGAALNRAQSNSRLRLMTGSSNWTGTISKRLRLDAPLGPVQIGKP